MPNQKTVKPERSLGLQLVEALTQQEITRLLDVLLTALPPEIRDKALGQLQPDTRQTVQRILAEPITAAETKAAPAVSISLAKLAQLWASLWQEWGRIVGEAIEEDGAYMTQEVHWEPPYFDETAFIADLEQVAKKMRPLLQSAFEHQFSPGTSFVEALAEAEDDVSTALPEWIYLESLDLAENLTFCLLEWEWLTSKEEEQDAFAFAQQILDQEDSFSYLALDSNAFLDFFTQLPETDQKVIFQGLTEHKNQPPWQELLRDTYSHWHAFYMYCVEQYAPEQYLDHLRDTIPQQWQNGLPIIEDFLTKQEYQEGLQVVKETLQAMLKSEQMDETWTPETSLLFVSVNRRYSNAAVLENYQKLLNYYRQIAQHLEQTDLVNILDLQLVAFDHFFDWKAIFKAFAEVSIPQHIHQALFESWRDYIIQRAKPYTYTWGFGQTQSRDMWWLHWLIDSIVDEQKGPAWFQQKMRQWLAQLPGERKALGEDYEFLRLLTKDLTEVDGQSKTQYPQFYQWVIRPDELSTPDQASRQVYLKQYAPDDLMDWVMAYWKVNLQNLVPRPENAEKSDYTSHARWMAALRELAPSDYESLLAKWRVEHQRRRNLWRDLAQLGLG
jgi:hypothetical protein